MAINDYGVAVNTIRVRGQNDIAPGTVFKHGNSPEAKRLHGMDAFREATDDEIKLYEAKVKDGDIDPIELGDTGSSEGRVIETAGTGQTVVQPTAVAPQAPAKEADKATKKNAAKDEDI